MSESPVPEPLKQTVYSSRISPGLGPIVLQDLLCISQDRNAQNGITGVLLLHNGRFLQCLEGVPAAVDATMARIRCDPRHWGIEVLAENPIRVRTYPDWSMGNVSIDAAAWERLILAEWRGLHHLPEHQPKGPEELSAIFERWAQPPRRMAVGKESWLPPEQALLLLAGLLALLLLWALFGVGPL